MILIAKIIAYTYSFLSKIMRLIISLIASLGVVVLAGCASTHNLREGSGMFGGGVMHEEIKPGLFRVRSATNWAPWPNEGSASSAWIEESSKACRGKTWKELYTKVSTHDSGLPSMGILKYLVSEKNGYVLCSDAVITEEEAIKLITIKF